MSIEAMETELKELSKKFISAKKNRQEFEMQEQSLKYDIQELRKKVRNERRGTLAPVDIQVNSDEGIFETVDEIDFSLKLDDPEESISLIHASFEEDNFAVSFSMDKDLADVVDNGKVQFTIKGDDGHYKSPVLESPTYFEAFQYFHQSIYKTGDTHHIYLESIELEKEVGGIKIYYFWTGS